MPRLPFRSQPRRAGVGWLARARGFTLIEVLLVVAVLGIAGALVIPSMTQTGVLRVQAAVRTLVADITYIQSDALAYQERRAIWFGIVARQTDDGWEYAEGNGYTVCAVTGAELDAATHALPDPEDPNRPFSRDFNDSRFGGSVIENIDFNGDVLLIFDELGGPVQELDGPDAGEGGSLVIDGSGSSFLVEVEAYTGRVTVTRSDAP